MFRTAEQMKKSCEGMRNYRSEMIVKERNLEKHYEEKNQEYQKLNPEAKIDYVKTKRQILITEQDKDFQFRFNDLKKEIAENKENSEIKKFKKFSAIDEIKNFAEKQKISPELAYKLIGDYSHKVTTLELLEAEGEFSKLLLHRQFVDNSIQDSVLNRKAKEKLGFIKNEKEEKDFRIIDSIIKQLEKPRNQFSGSGRFDNLA